jgi:orotidine-5'-phosphate decarboxylase
VSEKVKVFLALDVDHKNEAFDLVKKWSTHIQGFKVGPRLGFQLTQSEWSYLAREGELFLDYKFFDIPSTVKSSVDRAFRLGASFCTVHALNGEVCLKELSKLEKELNRVRPFKILAVTLLTSFDQETNKLPLTLRPSESVVKTLASLVVHSGLTGLVCSAAEAPMIKALYPKLTLVCPGVRFKGDSNDDQKRVLTPKEAFSNGADHLVMGRALMKVNQPNTVVQDLV